MPLPARPVHRKSLWHSIEGTLAFWLLVIAITVWPKHHTIALVLLALAIGSAVFGWNRVRRANEAIDEAEAASAPPPGSDPRAIEPEGKWSLLRLALLPIVLIGLLWEFHPLANAVLGTTPYRLLQAKADAAPPLRPGDQVWVRMTHARATSGAVIALWDDTHRWRLATVVGAPGDTVKDGRSRDWVERDESDQVMAVAYDLARPRAVPPDSIAVTIRSTAAGERPEVELCPAAQAEALALRIVFPPERWRLLP